MARERWTALRVDAPTLEPHPVLLARLSALSHNSAPVPGRVRRRAARALAVAASAAVVGTTSWAAGALPSTVSNVSSAQRPAATGLASPGAIGSPQPGDVLSPGVLLSPRTPGEYSPSATGTPGGEPRAEKSKANPSQNPDRPGQDRGAHHQSGRPNAPGSQPVPSAPPARSPRSAPPAGQTAAPKDVPRSAPKARPGGNGPQSSPPGRSDRHHQPRTQGSPSKIGGGGARDRDAHGLLRRHNDGAIHRSTAAR